MERIMSTGAFSYERNSQKCKCFVVLLALMVLMSGCGYTPGEKIQMNSYEKQGKKNAVDYIEYKYGFTPTVKSVEAATVNPLSGNLFYEYDFSPKPNGNVYVKMEYEGKIFSVYISGEEKNVLGYDNYQAEEIKEAFWAEMEEMLDTELKNAQIAFGLKPTTNELSEEWGLVQQHFDGSNLKEILSENPYQNAAFIHYIEGDTQGIAMDELCEQFGDNVNYLFLNYKDENAYELVKYHDAFTVANGRSTSINVRELALFIDDYMAVCYLEEEAEYESFDVMEQDGMYYMVECYGDDEVPYCNFEMVSLNEAATWPIGDWANYYEAVYKTYNIDTNADRMYVWFPYEALKPWMGRDVVVGNVNCMTAGYEWNKADLKLVGDNKYWCAEIITIGNYTENLGVYQNKN